MSKDQVLFANGILSVEADGDSVAIYCNDEYYISGEALAELLVYLRETGALPALERGTTSER